MQVRLVQSLCLSILRSESCKTSNYTDCMFGGFEFSIPTTAWRSYRRIITKMLSLCTHAGYAPHAADSSPPKTATLRGGSKSPLRRSPPYSSSVRSDDSVRSPSVQSPEISGLGQPRSYIEPALLPMTEEFSQKTAKLLGVQPMGPMACQSPMRIASMPRMQTEDILARIREKLKVFNILLVDHLKLSDKHAEGCITVNNFRRQMDQLRVFKLTAEELGALEHAYQVKIGQELRFNYRSFCSDLQPTGPDIAERIAALPRSAPHGLILMLRESQRQQSVPKWVVEICMNACTYVRSE